jgi:hypothetical protein
MFLAMAASKPQPVAYNKGVLIPTTTQKLIFHNPYKPVTIKFKNRSTQTLDILLPGMSSLCLCDTQWRSTVLKRKLIVLIHEPNVPRAEKYYLQKVSTPKGTAHHVTICVKMLHDLLPVPYLCMIQIRSKKYTDCGTKAVLNLECLVPESVREKLADCAYVMRTHFTGPGTFKFSCTDIFHKYCMDN